MTELTQWTEQKKESTERYSQALDEVVAILGLDADIKITLPHSQRGERVITVNGLRDAIAVMEIRSTASGYEVEWSIAEDAGKHQETLHLRDTSFVRDLCEYVGHPPIQVMAMDAAVAYLFKEKMYHNRKYNDFIGGYPYEWTTKAETEAEIRVVGGMALHRVFDTEVIGRNVRPSIQETVYKPCLFVPEPTSLDRPAYLDLIHLIGRRVKDDRRERGQLMPVIPANDPIFKM